MSARSAKLQRLLHHVDVLSVNGDPDVDIHGVTMDSREVKPGWLFVAITGQRFDGHEFVPQAVQRGAAAIISLREAATSFSVPVIIVADTKKALASISSEFYENPTSEFKLVGITGTNGKTTLTYLLESIAKSAGMNPGVVGTVEIRYGNVRETTAHTTPQAPKLQSLFRRMADYGVDVVFMEVSSHGLELERVFGCNFAVGVFTNLTRDHLDFHGDMKQYARAKALLFNRELVSSKAEPKVAIANADDPMSAEVTGGFGGERLLFGMHEDADIHPVGTVSSSLEGINATITTPVGAVRVSSRMVGKHNLENLTAAVAVASAMGLEPEVISAGISSCPVVPGRLEPVGGPSGCPAVFVDYAHTDDALDNVLNALAPLTSGRLIVVFGCGGDRDPGKRPLMGRAVANGADMAVVTSDNPRTEDPSKIIENIVPGLIDAGWRLVAKDEFGSSSGVFAIEENRRNAIELALGTADDKDVVLIAGKGHETYQLVGDRVLDFDDRVVAAELLAKVQQIERLR